MNRLNKKGEERILFVWMVGIWLIVGLFISWGVFIFYSTTADLRDVQAYNLNSRVVDCFSDSMLINMELFEKEQDIFSLCDFNKNDFDDGKFYFRVTLKDLASDVIINETFRGEKDFEVQCKIKENSDAKNFANCYENKIFVNYEKNEKINEGILEIFSGSNNLGGRV